MSCKLTTKDVISGKLRYILYLFSFSTLLFSQNYCINVCPFLDSITSSELTLNLFIIFLFHIIVREMLFKLYDKPFKELTLPRHLYYLSIISWMLAGVAAFTLHYYKYPAFPIGSHIKLLSSYWVLGAGIFAQLEYILYEKRYKDIAKSMNITFYSENIARRIVESFVILTIAPAITIFLVLARYYGQDGFSETNMIQEIAYIMVLFVFVAIISSVMFGRMLRKDTSIILNGITDIQKGNYDINIDITRADELGEISNAIETMADKIGILNKEIIDTQMEVVNKMGEVAETRSKETGNHVKRVALYSKLLALKYGLGEKEAELLKQASPMHDLGKVGIPDNILNKPGRHTPEEFEIMKTHAELGFNILSSSDKPILKAAAIVAHEHHEKWDGSGYPRGLKGEHIHIYGRITAVADVFDALGSDRVYKKAWDDEKIFAFFKEEREKHFDPQIIDIFFDNIEDMIQIRDSLKDKF